MKFHLFLLKSFMEVYTKPAANLINQFLQAVTLNILLKFSCVMQVVLKKPHKFGSVNRRPASLLPTFSKVFER